MKRLLHDRQHGFRGGRNERRRRLEAVVERLENRDLLSSGSVTQVGGTVAIYPASSGANTATVSYQGTNTVDVNLNGANYYFSLPKVGFVEYFGTNVGGSQMFQNETSLHSVAYGGSGTNLFVGGTGSDWFFGGSGTNTFDPGPGNDLLIGGSGINIFNLNATGSGVVDELGSSNTVNYPPGYSGTYSII